MQALLYGVRSTDALSFVSAVGALNGVVAAAALAAALGATCINPIEALRGE